MAYNYTNLENMLPLFGAMPNTLGGHHPGSFLSQLAATMTTAAVGAVTASSTSTTSMPVLSKPPKRERTPEPPPAPKLSSLVSPIMKPNQGTAPMDVENDSENESVPACSTATLTTSMASALTMSSKSTEAEKCLPLSMHDPNIFLNGLLPNATLNSGFMFFPAAATAAATTSTAPTSSMLMDPTAMMAAAMQQMQQSYAGYALPQTTESSAVDSTTTQVTTPGTESYPGGSAPTMKEVIKTKSCILFPPNPNAPPPTIRERPPGCRTIFVGGLPENITEEIIREIFESCGEITTLRMSKKNFCHIRYRHEASIDRAIYLSGYRVRISTVNEPANFGRLHVDYAQARDDQYDYECRQRQFQREQRHRERISLDRLRSQSPPPIQHYTDHEASVVAENLRNNDTFVKAIQTITVWLERGDCTKRNANVFYSMMQSTHAHVRRLYTDKQQLEEDLRKARESYRKQMLTMTTQFTQIEKVFNAASHKKVWDHFTKAQRKNIDQWKKLATELRSVQIEDDEMEVSDDDRECHSSSVRINAKRARYDSENLKEENDSLRCQLEAIRNEMYLDRTDIKYDSDFREKQIKVLQETIRNMQTQLLQTKLREQKDTKTIEELEQKLKEAGVKQLLLKTKIKETAARLKDKETASSVHSDTSEILLEEPEVESNSGEQNKDQQTILLHTGSKDKRFVNDLQIIDIDVYKSDDDVKIVEEQNFVVEIHEVEDDEQREGSQVMLNKNPLDHLEEPQKVDNKLCKYSDRDAQKINSKSEEKPVQEGKSSEDLNALTLSEAKIIALTVTFLVVQPFCVSTPAICSYLNKLLECEKLTSENVTLILQKYPNLFEALEGKCDEWKFCGFPTAATIKENIN